MGVCDRWQLETKGSNPSKKKNEKKFTKGRGSEGGQTNFRSLIQKP